VKKPGLFIRIREPRLKPYLKTAAFSCTLMVLFCMLFFRTGMAAAQEPDTSPDSIISEKSGDSSKDGLEIIGTLSYLAEELSFTADIHRAYLVPQTVYVGDTGRLTLHLEAYSGMFPFIQEKIPALPQSEVLVVNRLEMRKYEDSRDTREDYFQLLIDFTAYEPGILSFPLLKIPAGEPDSGVFYVSGLSVNIASILSSSSMELSGPALPLNVPGTSFLFYGTFAVLVLVCFSVVYFVCGRSSFRKIMTHIERRRLIRTMGKTIRHIRETGRQKAAEGSELAELVLLFSTEMRKTLSCLSALNCRALTAGELLSMVISVSDFYGFPNDEDAAQSRGGASPNPDDPRPIPPDNETQTGGTLKTQPDTGAREVLSPPFLGRLFRRCDILRFSGRSIDMVEFLAILDEAECFINTLNRAEKERNSRLKHILRKDNTSVYPVLKNEHKPVFSIGGAV
jgi:hypothetical protein